MTFAMLERYDFFTIDGACGKAEFMKINTIQAICISSCNGTYQKAMQYTVQWEERVTKTS